MERRRLYKITNKYQVIQVTLRPTINRRVQLQVCCGNTTIAIIDLGWCLLLPRNAMEATCFFRRDVMHECAAATTVVLNVATTVVIIWFGLNLPCVTRKQK
jgi:hypothetical protein